MKNAELRVWFEIELVSNKNFQSDTFAEGERPESPQVVGEKLSREGSPAPEAEGEGLQPDTAALEPGTPERSRPGL